MKPKVWLVGLAAIALMLAGDAAAVSPQVVKQLASRTHSAFRNQVMVQKIPIARAAEAQRSLLLRDPNVREVQQLRGGNLFVRFRDNNELLMLLGEDRLGSTQTPRYKLQQQPPVSRQVRPVAPQLRPQPGVLMRRPDIFERVAVKACAPESHRAVLYDALSDDANVVSPPIWQQARSRLQGMGYQVTTRLADNANLANAAALDNNRYGVILMRGHGGVFGSDFAFLVRPWYTSYPPANSGYVGTIRVSAYNHAASETQFGYGITGQFANEYWDDQAFPRTVFFLESCHGTDPPGLPGMPTYATDHGAIAWLGWNESVSFNCGDNGTKLFFDRIAAGDSLGEAVQAVFNTGCRPPELTIHPGGRNGCKLAVWKSDPNEGPVPNNKDFERLRLVGHTNQLFADVDFYGAPAVSEFFFYVDTGGGPEAEVLVKAHAGDFAVYKSTGSGTYNNKVYTGTPRISGHVYAMVIPWDTAFGGASTLKAWTYDMGSRDRMPDSGSLAVRR